ncbi:hypothetical protein HCN51_20030 [Nonomuraea sp. FMUSA5-5]|uniref:Uncharacterized protein n=1 Tax=Nonomuraea composti TaxID=2720023 RepID=A0ABX1B1K2_9ACTN|nr:hypothetical protein [Nonomuraea sp. FMUSA5-5]NJP91719.1 hypothetical protein [Nonomuraea sp. FMUSA5-5]
MSKSPKFAWGRAGDEARRQREAEQEERRRHRQEEAGRRRMAALETVRHAEQRRLADLRHRYAALPLRPDTSRSQDALDALNAELAAATTARHVDRLAEELDELARRYLDTAAHLATGRPHAHEVVAALRALAAEPDLRDRLRFDEPGAQLVSALLAELSAGDDAYVRAHADEAATAIRAHVEKVTLARARHERDRAAAMLAAADVTARLAALEAEAELAQVPLKDAPLAHVALEMISRESLAGRYGEVRVLCGQVDAKLDDMERELDADIDRFTERRQMLAAVVDILPELGLVMDAGSLDESPDGTLTLQVHRLTGSDVTVVLEDDEEGDHRILYLSDDMRRAQEQGGQARQSAACAALLEVAELAGDSMRQEGFTIGEVDWEGSAETRRPVTQWAQADRKRGRNAP